MTQPKALQLAAMAHLGYRVGWQREAAAELRRLHASNQALLEVVQKYIAWSKAESNHDGTTFWERVEMCREVDELARAAIKAAEEGAK